MYANARNEEVKKAIVNLYEQGLYPQEIQKELNLQYVQPVYNLLKKYDIYETRPTRCHRKYHFNERFFENIDTEEKAYSLGFVVADGHVDTIAHRVRVQLHSQDRDILEKILSAVESDSSVRDITHEGRPHVRLELNSKLMEEDLLAKGLTNNKSLTMTGEVFSHVPKELQRHFLRGYFDGDGSVMLGRRYSSGIKYSIQIIGTKEFLESTYGVCCVTNCSLMKYKTCDMWCWKVSAKQQVLDFLHFIYDNSLIALDRKKRYFLDFLESECAHVKSGELLEA